MKTYTPEKDSKLTAEDVKWLEQHGGRKEKDVAYDEQGKFILMGDRKGLKEKVYF